MIQLDVGHFQLLSVYPALPSARHWNLSLLAIKSTQWMPEVLDCTIEAWCLPLMAGWIWKWLEDFVRNIRLFVWGHIGSQSAIVHFVLFHTRSHAPNFGEICIAGHNVFQLKTKLIMWAMNEFNRLYISGLKESETIKGTDNPTC